MQKQWKKVSFGNVIKWDTPGKTLEGTWCGQTDGRFGPLGVLKTPEGELRFPFLAAIRQRLQDVKEGTEVKITYLGVVPLKDGREYKAFEVFHEATDGDGHSGEGD